MGSRAQQIFDDLVQSGDGNPNWAQVCVEDIEAILLAERERCAEIARNWPDRIEGRGIAERIMDDAR